jgi:hypothetical protein
VNNFSLQLNALQLKVVSGIQKSAFFKQQLVARTVELPIGTTIRLGGEFYTIQQQLGAGLIGVVYHVVHCSSNESFALKRSRANFAFFREALRVECEVTKLLCELNGPLGVVAIHYSSKNNVLKTLCSLPTLQELLFNDRITTEHQMELEKCLTFCAELFNGHSLLLDLSPKNIVWNGNQWLLVDAGPKIHQSDFSEVLEKCTWSSYRSYVESRVMSADSQPSVLNHSEDAPTNPSATKHWVFVKEWWDWFPVEDVKDDFFYTEHQASNEEDEFIYYWSFETQTIQVLQTEGDHPLIRLLAQAAWKNIFHTNAPESLTLRANEWLFSNQTEPINWSQFITEINSFGLGQRIKELFPEREHLPIPTLNVREYKHWHDIFTRPQDHHVTDIFCHNPLPVPKVLNRPDLPSKRLELPTKRPHLFAEMEFFGTKNQHKAVLILPGFRATNAAAYTLIQSLHERGVNDPFIVVEIGALNNADQKLVTAGRWELIVLWEIIEYCLHALEIDTLEIIAASHGAIGAWFMACMHPSIKKVVLDSPLLQPMNLVGEIALKRSEPIEPIVQHLLTEGMPAHSYAVFQHPPKDLQVLTLRPEKDLFGELCGELSVGNCIHYKGGHAATLRHDSGLKGIPNICIDAISDFLKTNETPSKQS